MDREDILTIDQRVTAFPAFGEKTVRWWIYNGKRNGFEACLIRIGSRICIDRNRFIEWLKSHRPVRDVAEEPRPQAETLEDVE